MFIISFLPVYNFFTYKMFITIKRYAIFVISPERPKIIDAELHIMREQIYLPTLLPVANKNFIVSLKVWSFFFRPSLFFRI